MTYSKNYSALIGRIWRTSTASMTTYFICSVFGKNIPVLSSSMTYHQIYNQSNTTDATIVARNAYHSGAPESTSRIQWDSCCSIFGFLFSVLLIVVRPFSFDHCFVCTFCDLRKGTGGLISQMDYLTTHTSLPPIQRGFTPSFVNYKKECIRLTAASDVYQLLAHGRWFSLASSATITGRHDIAEGGVKHQKSNQSIIFYFMRTQ